MKASLRAGKCERGLGDKVVGRFFWFVFVW